MAAAGGGGVGGKPQQLHTLLQNIATHAFISSVVAMPLDVRMSKSLKRSLMEPLVNTRVPTQ